MYPGYRSSWQRKLNAALLARFMRETFDRLDQATVVSTVPIVADLPDRLRAKRWVYYCVDDFSAWPGLDAEPMRSMESTFVRRADRIIAAGANLAERMGALGRSADIITHGVDLDHWRAPVRPTAIFDGLLRPIVLFWGLIDRRLDIQALSALDRLMSQGTIVFAGPEQNPDPALRELARARCIGVIPFDTLPSLAAQAAVLIVPYADLPVTRAMQPLKLKEYLATERPVVTTRLPAVTGWEECLDVSNGPENFATLVLRRLNTGLPREQVAGRKRLRQESWGVKSAKFAEILFND